MALCSHTLVRTSWPNRFNRRPLDALGLVPETAVLPHFGTFGHRWVPSARRELPQVTLLGIDERSAAVWTEDGWRAAGAGVVTVIRGVQASTFKTGMRIAGLPSPARMLASQ
jgi:cyanophycinase-like exopeptidase